jgi:hypothetical protein
MVKSSYQWVTLRKKITKQVRIKNIALIEGNPKEKIRSGFRFAGVAET